MGTPPQPLDVHDFIFCWFNERHCDEMAQCLNDFQEARNPVTGAPLSPREQFEAESG